jgi:hypothetical protein
LVRHDRPAARRPRLLTSLVALLTAGAATIGFAAPATADVSEVGGGAFGYSATVSLFGGAPASRGPAPTVTLPANGSASPVTGSAPAGDVKFGPATIFDSGPMQVSTKGTTGPNGSVESSATVTGKPDGPGPILYGELKSSCTAKEGEVSGSTTVNGGTIETKLDKDSGTALSTEPIPTNPAPNTEITGTVDTAGDNFRVVLNEQVKSGNGITVNAAHLYLLGPSAVGDLIIGQSRCSAAAGASRAAQPAPTTTRAPSEGSTAATTTTTATGGGGQGGSGSSTTGGDNMPNTGMDLAPLVILGSAFVLAGAIVLVDDPRRRLRPRRPGARP